MTPNLTLFHLLAVSLSGWLSKEQPMILEYLLADKNIRSQGKIRH
jgi:hypothetical protein